MLFLTYKIETNYSFRHQFHHSFKTTAKRAVQRTDETLTNEEKSNPDETNIYFYTAKVQAVVISTKFISTMLVANIDKLEAKRENSGSLQRKGVVDVTNAK